MSAPPAAGGTVVVLAKAPVPGRVKTRLHPPLTLGRAADLAAAALEDVLAAATGARAGAVVLALDGVLADLPDGVLVVPQVDGGLDRRIAGAFAAAADVVVTDGVAADGPLVLVGMDTPQVLAADLDAALAAVGDDGADAALGPALDGGWWVLAVRRPEHAALVLDVPTSTDGTGAATLAALRAGGLDVADLPAARDVDTWEDALAVAQDAPGTRFAAAVATAADELATAEPVARSAEGVA